MCFELFVQLRVRNCTPTECLPSLDILSQRNSRQANTLSCQIESVLQEHGNSHRSDATWHRSDLGCYLLGLVEFDVTHKAIAKLFTSIVDCIDADINDDTSRLQPVTSDILSLTNGSD